MATLETPRTSDRSLENAAPAAPRIVVGITHPQTCLTLTGRLKALRAAGFDVMLVCSPGELLDSTAAREGVRAIPLPMRRGIAPLSDARSLFRLWRLLRRLRPALAEFSTPKAGLLGGIAAWMVGVPVRIYMLRGLKLDTASGWKRSILLAAERVSAACAQVVLCNSTSLRAESEALGIAPARKLSLIGNGSSNGVNVDRFCPGPTDVRERLGLRRESPVIGFVGRLTRDKGIPELVDAFDLILRSEPEAHLLLVGWFDASDDALSPSMRERIQGQPRICYSGFVQDTVPWYRAMDVLVLPTWREGFPNAVLEAAATGIPVITTQCTGSRDSVIPEVTGMLIPPGCPEAIAETVMELLHDPARRRRMGQAGRKWVEENFSDRHVLALTVDYYRNLVHRKS
jgi:glycosyltransferase involved in cell wall biosynthesis